MRVISIIVHLIALCDPALHKTTEDVAHPSLLNKRGVNFALLLFFSFLQFSLEAFYSISSMLRVLATMPWSGMHSLCCAFFVSFLLIIFQTTFILSSNYARQFLFITHSLVSSSHRCPAIQPEIERALVAALRESA